MNIELPTIPAGVLVLLALVAPYVQALIQRPTWSPVLKKILAVVLALAMTGAVLAFYYVYTGDTVPAWPVLVLLAIVVAQASYTLVTKTTAAALEQRTSPESESADEVTYDDIRDDVLARLAILDPDEQTTEIQAALSRRH